MEWVALFGLIIVWRWAASRHRRLEGRLEEIELLRTRQENVIAQLTQRVFRLETATRIVIESPVAEPVVAPVAAPVVAPVVEVPQEAAPEVVEEVAQEAAPFE